MSIERMRRSAAWLSIQLLVSLLATGCLEPQSREVRRERTCTACHGDENRLGDVLSQSAPPRDLDGNSETRFSGVGAHERHLSRRGHAPVACATCHRVPDEVFSPGHVDSKAPAEVRLTGPAVSQSESSPEYEAESGNCSNTYCHRKAAVQWTAPRSEAETCGTCHGLPPALPHPQSSACANCHGEVIGADGRWVAPERHVDGKLDLRYEAPCNACHGTNPTHGAPPADLNGNREPRARGVGAHANHLQDTATHRAIACSECHEVPAQVAATNHLDGDGRAEVRFGELATWRGRSPTYDGTSLTCENTYCHGAATALWTAPREADAACGSCHGLPPALPHPRVQQCSNCHGRVIDSNGKIIEPSLHVNGSVELDYVDDCSSCHGTGKDGAPPPDLKGNVAVSARGVGAHAVHLVASGTHGAVACGECHRVPTRTDDSSHLDGDGTAEVAFGPIASTGDRRPQYDSTLAGCQNTYCHRDAVVSWQAPRSSAAACGSCHALPPPPPHPVAADCSQCHGAVIDGTRRFTEPARHVDGKVDFGTMKCDGCHGAPPAAPHPQKSACVQCHSAVVDAVGAIRALALHANGRVELDPMPCNACHGTSADGAPPPDLAGQTSPTLRGIGAHAIHLEAGATHAPIACRECHAVPDAWHSPGHMDSPLPAEISFGPLAKSLAMSPVYLPSNGTCAGSYCHRAANPVWTAPRGSACGSCHGLPPQLPHPQSGNCAECHGEVIDAVGRFVRPELHVDGTTQVVQRCNTCHGGATNSAPPSDLTGGSEPGRIGVGAHQIHLSGGMFGRPLACGECHVVPATVTAAGHLDLVGLDPAEVFITGPGAANGRSAAWDRSIASCRGSYCHGPSDPTNQSPSWVRATTTSTCTSCHAMPPRAPHPADARCSRCHAGVDAQDRITDRNLHVNGEVDLL